MARQSWDDYFMELAYLAATRATCDRLHVGAILVRDRRVIATGYNGSPKGLPHCDDVGHLMVDGHCKRTLHAEQNVILQCALYGVSTQGSVLYTTHFPCDICAKLIIGAGIKAVYYGGEYKNEIAEEILALAGIPVIRLERKPDTPTNPFDSCVVNRPKQEYFLTCNDRTPADG